MMQRLLAFLLTLAVTSSAPTTVPILPLLPRSALTASALELIAPTSNTCNGATHTQECKTADQALPFILASFDNYNITAPATQAALLSTMAYETSDFKYARNYFPGTPGQGTRNMQSAAFNLMYAQSIPALAPYLPAAQAAGQNGILDLLLEYDDYDFGSAAWFLASQCSFDVQSTMAEGGSQALTGYLGCIGTAEDPQRDAYYQRAKQALGVSS